MKKVAILTSGGDAPGMNACVRAAVRYGIYRGYKTYGVERGYRGLIEDDIFQMYPRSVSDIVQKGGTILHTSRCPEFKDMTFVQKRRKILKNVTLTILS